MAQQPAQLLLPLPPQLVNVFCLRYAHATGHPLDPVDAGKFIFR
jgi:hypothetical protein